MWMFHEIKRSISFPQIAPYLWVWFLFMLKVKKSKIHNWQGSHSDVVKLIYEWFVKRLTREHGPKSKEKLSCDIEHILVESI